MSRAERLRLRAAVRLLLLATFGFLLISSLAPVAIAQPSGSAQLSWQANALVPDIDAPKPEWLRTAGEVPSGAPQTYHALLHLDIASSQPLDSLGFFLRWAASDRAARVALRGIRAGTLVFPASALSDSASAARDSLEGLPILHVQPLTFAATDMLANLATRDERGGWVYRLGLQIDFSGTNALRIQAAGLGGRTSAGESLLLGDPVATIGNGWQLNFPPLLTEVRGRLNKRYLQSVLSLRGFDLDMLATFFLINAGGRIHYATSVDRFSSQRVDVAMSNSSIGEGWWDLEYWSADGVRKRLPQAILAAYLPGSLPGDTNRGAKPDSNENAQPNTNAAPNTNEAAPGTNETAPSTNETAPPKTDE